MAEIRIALVTGASSGIGAETARQLAAIGWRVVACGRNMKRLETVRNSFPDQVLSLEMDVLSSTSIAYALKTLPAGWQDVSAVVNAAGQAPGGRKRFDLSPLTDRLATVDTNLLGVMRVCHAIVPGLIARGGGDIVNIGSVAGQQPARNDAAYTASKFGLRGFTEGLRLDLFGTNIRVVEIRPGLTHTRFAETRMGTSAEAEKFYAEMPGLMQPKDVADCVLFALGMPPHVTLNEIVLHPTSLAPNR